MIMSRTSSAPPIAKPTQIPTKTITAMRTPVPTSVTKFQDKLAAARQQMEEMARKAVEDPEMSGPALKADAEDTDEGILSEYEEE